jgi:hypothetical protein
VSLVAHRGGLQSSNRVAVLKVLRTVRDGGTIDGLHLPTIEAMTEAVSNGWLEVLNDRARVEKWRYRLTREGAKQAGPVLRLIVGGRK